MTDCELLEMAAKAVGIEFSQLGGGARYDPKPSIVQPYVSWNPLIDDGDALRLMARLNINVHYRENLNGAFVIADRHDIQVCAESLDGPHEDDATRRAIVRAAAEIGKVGNL